MPIGRVRSTLLKCVAIFFITVLASTVILSVFSTNPEAQPLDFSVVQGDIYSEYTGWSADARISNGPLGSGSPNIALDSQGTRHVVWSDNKNGLFEIYYTALSSDNEPLIAETRITRTLFNSLHPFILIDDSGCVHISWLEASLASWDIYYTFLDQSSGEKWEKVHIVQVVDFDDGYMPSIGNGILLSYRAGDTERFRPLMVVDKNGVGLFASVSSGNRFQLKYFEMTKNEQPLEIAPWVRGDSFFAAMDAHDGVIDVLWIEKGNTTRLWHSKFEQEFGFLTNSILLDEAALSQDIVTSITSGPNNKSFSAWAVSRIAGESGPSFLFGAVISNSTVVEQGRITSRYHYPISITSSIMGEGVCILWAEEEPGVQRSFIMHAVYNWTMDPILIRPVVRGIGSSQKPMAVTDEGWPVMVWEDTRDSKREVYIKHVISRPLPQEEEEEDKASENTRVSVLPTAGGMGLLALLFYVSRHKELLLLVPAYSRLSENDIVSNPTRKMIIEYIEDKPGSNFTHLMDCLELKNGVLAHHLKTLERAGFIRSKKDGALRRYYPSGYTAPMSLDEKILFTLASNPGISQSQLADKLDVTRQVINYHIKDLMKRRKIALRREGKNTCCYALSLNPD